MIKFPKCGVLMLDGGLGTFSESKGIDISTPVWTATLLENEGRAEGLHKEFFHAGADVCSTVTYQASYHAYTSMGMSPSHVDLAFQRAVTEAAKARIAVEDDLKRNLYIAGSLGPYGAYLNDGSECNGIYKEDVSDITFEEFHRPRLNSLVKAAYGTTTVDVVLFESLADSRELKVIVKLLNQTPTLHGGGAWLSVACCSPTEIRGGRSFADTIAEVLKEDTNHCVGGIGINCTPSQYVHPLITNPKFHSGLDQIGRSIMRPMVFSAAADADSDSAPPSDDLRLLVYPTCHFDAAKHCHSPSIPDTSLAENCVSWANQGGASAVGGCCGVYPQDIRNARQKLVAANLCKP